MKINIQKDASSRWKQTYYKLNSPLAELYDEFAYYNDDQHIWFEQSATDKRNSLSIALDDIPKLIEQGVLIDTYGVQPKGIEFPTLDNREYLVCKIDEDGYYSIGIKTAKIFYPTPIIQTKDKQEYLDFVNKLKEFVDE